MKKGATENSPTDLGARLNLIKLIAKDYPKGKSTNTINNVDLTGKNEDAILREFVKFAQSKQNATAADKQNVGKEKLKAIFEYFGTNLSNRARYSAEQIHSREIPSGIEEDDEDEGGDLDQLSDPV